MIDPDKQLIRSYEEGVINLSIGEPLFLHQHMAVPDYETVELPTFPLYPPYRGEPELLELLQRRHWEQIVITNGAKQALLAGLYALRRKYGYNELSHRAPHWPSYPTMAAFSGMRFTTVPFDLSTKNTCVVMTSPNNPDSWVSMPGASCDIWDAAYAHPVYGWDSTMRPEHKISVWSAAKLFGLSGLRIGWLATSDQDLARDAADYVEKTTSGVNTEAQRKLLETLRRDGQGLHHYVAARTVLIDNGRIFDEYIRPHCAVINGLPSQHRGMFAWFRAEDPEKFERALRTARVSLVSGRACGMNEDGWWRMSLGGESYDLRKHLKTLAEALK